jgi:hypothetical protein
MERGKSATSPLTKFDIYFERELEKDESTLPDDPILDDPKFKRNKRKIVDGKVVGGISKRQ